MTNDRDLDKKVRSWLDEPPVGPPDRDAVYARVMDRLPQTHQRRHWWPFQWNPFAASATRSAEADGPHPQGRSRIMFTAIRVATAATVLALAGSVAFVAGPFEPIDRSVPSASEVWTAEDVVRVSARSTYVGKSESGPIEVTPERVLDHGGTHEFALDSDDPRFDGAMYVTGNHESILGAPGASVLAGVVRIEAETGTWEGAISGFGMVGTNDMYNQIKLSGGGANEGLSAVLLTDDVENEVVAYMEGMVFPGELPQYP